MSLSSNRSNKSDPMKWPCMYLYVYVCVCYGEKMKIIATLTVWIHCLLPTRPFFNVWHLCLEHVVHVYIISTAGKCLIQDKCAFSFSYATTECMQYFKIVNVTIVEPNCHPFRSSFLSIVITNTITMELWQMLSFKYILWIHFHTVTPKHSTWDEPSTKWLTVSMIVCSRYT